MIAGLKKLSRTTPLSSPYSYKSNTTSDKSHLRRLCGGDTVSNVQDHRRSKTNDIHPQPDAARPHRSPGAPPPSATAATPPPPDLRFVTYKSSPLLLFSLSFLMTSSARRICQHSGDLLFMFSVFSNQYYLFFSSKIIHTRTYTRVCVCVSF